MAEGLVPEVPDVPEFADEPEFPPPVPPVLSEAVDPVDCCVVEEWAGADPAAGAEEAADCGSDSVVREVVVCAPVDDGALAAV